MNVELNQQPSALSAVCAQVLDAAGRSTAAATAHTLIVGLAAVRTIPSVGTPQIQAQRWTRLQGRGVRVNGMYGFAAAGSAMVGKAVDVVGGVPPRGRPV